MNTQTIEQQSRRTGAAATRASMQLKVGDPTPWGPADDVRELAAGVWLVDTPSHGGLHLAGAAKAAVPQAIQDSLINGSEWAEEDCELPIVLAVLHNAGHVPAEALWTKPAALYRAAHQVAGRFKQYAAAAKLLPTADTAAA